jgi:predicted TIM-barrel fold metal-dependent hydrolase
VVRKGEDPVNFSSLPVIDTHCHFFDVSSVEHDLVKTLNLSLSEVPEEDLRNTLAYHQMLRELKQFLGVSAGEDVILAERKRRMDADYKAYVTDLIRDAHIDTLLVDTGYKPAAVSVKAFEELVSARVRYIYRIESVLDEMWHEHLPFPKAEDRFAQALDEAIGAPEVVAIKSIIGYRTGLRVKDVSRSSLLKDVNDEKSWRDYFFLRAVERSIETGCPVQVHSGFGESNIDLSANNPLLLKGFLEDSKYRAAQIVLLHGSYPYSFEAGYLANVYPNVFLDLSEANLFAPYGFREGLRTIFDMCPFNKAMYGSDGFLVPEGHWLGAKTAKQGLGLLFGRYVNDGLFDEDSAWAAAKMILFETAERVYHLTG